MAAPQRNFGLDLLRCLAITIVLAHHGFINIVIDFAHLTTWEGTTRRWSLLSLLSIEWLFVLSGFLIGTMMIRAFDKTGTFWSRARSFWLRRWFRTVPNYYLFLLVNIALFAAGLTVPLGSGPPTWGHALFSHNLWRPERIPFFFSESWSLALDEWFYLLLPLLVGIAALAFRNPRDRVMAATAVLIVTPLVLRLVMPMPPASQPLEWDHQVRRITVMHLDATGWGVLAAAANRWWPTSWVTHLRTKAIIGIAFMVVAEAALWDMFGVLPGPLAGVLTAWRRLPFAFALTLMAAGTALALPAIASLRRPRSSLSGLAEGLSNITYSVYLSHIPLLILGLAAFDRLGTARTAGPLAALFLLWLAATLIASWAVYRGFEKPVSDLRDRFTHKVDANPFGPATPP